MEDRGVVAAVAVLFLVTMGIASLVPNLNPFGTKEVDRSGPVLLQSIRDLSQYHAAAGEFQVVIDLEKDVKWVPSFLAGSRALFIAAGSVNAFEVRVPEPQLDRPNLDQQRSYQQLRSPFGHASSPEPRGRAVPRDPRPRCRTRVAARCRGTRVLEGGTRVLEGGRRAGADRHSSMARSVLR